MSPPKKDDSGREPPVGRRGGKTTMTSARVRKTFWIERDVEARLRRDALETGRKEAELVREALRVYYDIE